MRLREDWKGSTHKRWIENIREDMKNKGLEVSDDQDRNKWQMKTQDP